MDAFILCMYLDSRRGIAAIFVATFGTLHDFFYVCCMAIYYDLHTF